MEAEHTTRTSRINPRLKAAGWSVIAFDSLDDLKKLRSAIEELPTAAGPADYALADGGDLLGVVEAKKRNCDERGGRP